MNIRLDLNRALSGPHACEILPYLELFDRMAGKDKTKNVYDCWIDPALKAGDTLLNLFIKWLPGLGLPGVGAEDISVSGIWPQAEGGKTVTVRSPLWTLEVIARGIEYTLSVRSSHEIGGLLVQLHSPEPVPTIQPSVTRGGRRRGLSVPPDASGLYRDRYGGWWDMNDGHHSLLARLRLSLFGRL